MPKDASTLANIDAFVAKHLVLDLTADFTAKTLSGTAELRFDRRDPNASEVVLDTRDLTIEKVEAAAAPARGWRRRTGSIAGDARVRQRAAHRDARRRRPRARDVLDVAIGARSAVARAEPDGRQEAAVPVQSGAGDSGAVVHPAAGHARRAHDLRRDDPHAEGSRRVDGRRDGAEEGRRGGVFALQDAAADPVVSDRDRDRRSRLQADERPHRRVGRARRWSRPPRASSTTPRR